MHDYVRALTGGAVIGLAASLLLLFNGRIAGISGIVAGILTPTMGDVRWRVAFALGLLLGGLAVVAVDSESIGVPSGRGLGAVAVAGLLVGFGVRLGGGCTSGHGVCGVTRRSRRSIVATGTFMSAGGFMAFVAGHLLGGGS